MDLFFSSSLTLYIFLFPFFHLLFTPLDTTTLSPSRSFPPSLLFVAAGFVLDLVPLGRTRPSFHRDLFICLTSTWYFISSHTPPPLRPPSLFGCLIIILCSPSRLRIYIYIYYIHIVLARGAFSWVRILSFHSLYSYTFSLVFYSFSTSFSFSSCTKHFSFSWCCGRIDFLWTPR